MLLLFQIILHEPKGLVVICKVTRGYHCYPTHLQKGYQCLDIPFTNIHKLKGGKITQKGLPKSAQPSP